MKEVSWVLMALYVLVVLAVAFYVEQTVDWFLGTRLSYWFCRVMFFFWPDKEDNDEPDEEDVDHPYDERDEEIYAALYGEDRSAWPEHLRNRGF